MRQRVVLSSLSFVFMLGGLLAAEDDNPNDIFKRPDANKDGELTKDEIPAEQRQFFKRIIRIGDKDRNGVITRDEFSTALKKDDEPVQVPANNDARRRRTQGGLRQFFSRTDRNRDGKLSLDEMPEFLRTRFKPVFQELKKDSVTLEEFLKIQTRLWGGRNRSGFNPDEFFKRFDTNKDGKLTLQELPEPMRPRFKRTFDRLGKESLSREELTRAMERMASYVQPNRTDQTNTPKPVPNRSSTINNSGVDRSRVNSLAEIAGWFFDRLDTNGDGVLTISESTDQNKRIVQRFLERTGNQQNGSVSKTEFLKLGSQANQRGVRSNVRPRGDSDSNNPSRRQTGRGFRSSGMLFRMLDVNRDGALSKVELENAGKFFNQLDRNKNGKLEPGELSGSARSSGADRVRRPNGNPNGNSTNRSDRRRRPDAAKPVNRS